LRQYIFTDTKRERLKTWLDGQEADQTTLNLFVDIRRNLNNIKRDVDLLAKASGKLRDEERLMGHVRISKKTSTEPDREK